MYGGDADEKRPLALHERLPRKRVVDRIAADADLHRRHAEIPSAPLGHRQVKTDAAVGDAAVPPAGQAHMLLDDEDAMRVGVYTRFRGSSLLIAKVHQIEA